MTPRRRTRRRVGCWKQAPRHERIGSGAPLRRTRYPGLVNGTERNQVAQDGLWEPVALIRTVTCRSGSGCFCWGVTCLKSSARGTQSHPVVSRWTLV